MRFDLEKVLASKRALRRSLPPGVARPKPIRVWLEVSENDNGAKSDEASLHNWVLANQRMAAAPEARV